MAILYRRQAHTLQQAAAIWGQPSAVMGTISLASWLLRILLNQRASLRFFARYDSSQFVPPLNVLMLLPLKFAEVAGIEMPL